ncbi:MAG: YqgE/AlgH family protein [Rikenellaceae bacterium]|nr:YqgE/AlgH family protein [Rikenellaceae bacterium]
MSKPYDMIRPGSVLVAEPYLGDAYFGRATVLIAEHNESGSVGFILNKPLTFDVADLVAEFPSRGFTLGLGGPLQPQTLHFVHTLGSSVPGSVPLYGNLSWGGDFEVLCRLVEAGMAGPGDVRFFLGYSSWAEGQLREETEQEEWAVTTVACETIMEDTEGLWYDLVARMPGHTHWLLVPLHPEDN